MADKEAELASIHGKGSVCRDKLQALTLANPLRKDGSQGGHSATWPEELLARFDYLASDIGLFNLGDSSIDHRLGRNKIVRTMVEQYLQAISANADIGTVTFPYRQ
jgi:hypothetical protein